MTPARQAGYVIGLLVSATLTFAFVVATAESFASAPDPKKRCNGAGATDCMRRQAAIVRGSSDAGLRVAYDDGVHSTTLWLRGDARPAAGAHVQLERWNGDVVALYDLARERRYRTHSWPVRWSGDDFVAPLVLGTVSLAIFGCTVRGFARKARA